MLKLILKETIKAAIATTPATPTAYFVAGTLLVASFTNLNRLSINKAYNLNLNKLRLAHK
jgi:hypothetical protein